MERLGDMGRSREKRTDWAEGEELARLRRVGEAGRWKKVEEREEKLEVEEAKAEEDEYRVLWNLPAGEAERMTGPHDDLLELAAAMFVDRVEILEREDWRLRERKRGRGFFSFLFV